MKYRGSVSGHRISHVGVGVEHLVDSRRRCCRPRDHHEGHDGHHHGEENLHDVGEKRREVADGHVAAIDEMPSEPDDGHRREVHDEHEHRHDDREHASDLQRRVSEVAIRIRESGLLCPRSIECPHDANPREVLAQHEIDAVDLELHCLEQRDCPRHHDRDDSKHDGDDDEQEPGQLGILANRHDDRAHGSHGREHHHRQACHHKHLNLLNVVGVASDERGHPNDIHLTE